MATSAAAPTTTHHGSGGSILFGLAPFIVMWILMGVVDFRVAAIVAFAVSLIGPIISVSRHKPHYVLDTGAAIWFLLILILAFTSGEAFLQEWLQPIVNGGLLLISLASLAMKQPFVLQYARDQVSEDVAQTDNFQRVCWTMTWVWTGLFAVMTVSSLIPPLMQGTSSWADKTDTVSIIFYWVIPIAALIYGIYFTKHYPEYYRSKVKN